LGSLVVWLSEFAQCFTGIGYVGSNRVAFTLQPLVICKRGKFLHLSAVDSEPVPAKSNGTSISQVESVMVVHIWSVMRPERPKKANAISLVIHSKQISEPAVHL
jgi:hypothetical protein